MKWLEIIEIRSNFALKDLLGSHLHQFEDEINRESEGPSVTVFIRANLSLDYVLLLLHDSKEIMVEGSHWGFQLASALKEFGSVSHGIWKDLF